MAGVTLYSITKKYNVSLDQMKQANHLTTETISVGQVLTIMGYWCPPQSKRLLETCVRVWSVPTPANFSKNSKGIPSVCMSHRMNAK